MRGVDRECSASHSFKEQHREHGLMIFKRMLQVPNVFRAELELRDIMFLIPEP